MSDDDDHGLDASDAADRRILLTVLLINLGQCLAGVGVGVWASSTALIGAALDNLSDALVYGVSLYAIGRSVTIKVRAARLSGWLLIGLAVVLLVEVLRRFFGGEPPLGPAMMAMAALNERHQRETRRFTCHLTPYPLQGVQWRQSSYSVEGK